MADNLPRPRKAPCGTCPYRVGVPAGIWAAEEYEKLPTYDGGTWEQMVQGAHALFYCHQQDGNLCAGWAACHDARHLLAYRLWPVHPDTYTYSSPLPVFASGAEAAAHGLSGIAEPAADARRAITKLERKRGKRKAPA